MPLRKVRFKSTQITENGPGKLFFVIMVSTGFVISGILERLPDSNPELFNSTAEVNQSDIAISQQGRRYCDPPNMSAVAIYFGSNEETNVFDYDLLQQNQKAVESEISAIDLEEHKVDIYSNWGYILSFFPACYLTSKHGSHRVFPTTIFLELAVTLLSLLVKNVQVIQSSISGFLLGILTFSFYEMSFHFVATSRNSLISFISVRQIGLAIGELLLGFAVKKSYVFYAISVATAIWLIVWSRIRFIPSRNDIHYEGNNREKNSDSKSPWKSILSSRPVWMTIAAIFGASCGLSCIFLSMKWYLKYVYFFQMEILSAVSSFLHVGFAIVCGCFIDFLIRASIVSVTSSRRMIVYVSHFIPAGLLFVLGFLGCNQTTPLIFYCLAVMLTGANYTGALSSPLDLAPKYAGLILALCFTFGSIGLLSMNYLIFYALTKQVFISWRFIFSLNSLILLLTAIFFMLRGSGSVQPWNDPKVIKEGQNKNVPQGKLSVAEPVPKPRTKSIYMVEKKILKVLHVQEPDKFTRVRAYSTSLPNERSTTTSNIYRPSNKKRASIS